MSLLAQNVNRPEARLLYARQKSFSPDWPTPSYVHTGSELVFVLEGRGYFQIQGISHPLAGGGLLIIGPGVEHAQASEGSAPMSCVVLGVEGSSALLAPAAGWISAPLPDLLRELRPLLWAMVEESGQQREGFQLVCQNLLEVVLIRLSRGLRLELRAVERAGGYWQRGVRLIAGLACLGRPHPGVHQEARHPVHAPTI